MNKSARLMLLLKSHISAYTRKDGTFVAAHEDRRMSAHPEQHSQHATGPRQDGGGADARPAQNVTDTPSFKRWFGDSKVVDSKGKPLVVYHGTQADFDTFDMDSDERDVGGVWFSDSKNYAHDMSKGAGKAGWDAADRRSGGSGRVMEVYLSVQKPMVLDVVEEAKRIAEEIGADPPEDSSQAQELLALGDGWDSYVSDLVRDAKRNGHDGLIITSFNDGRVADSTAYIVFDPKKIKSATDNDGAFDPDSDNITKSAHPILMLIKSIK